MKKQKKTLGFYLKEENIVKEVKIPNPKYKIGQEVLWSKLNIFQLQRLSEITGKSLEDLSRLFNNS